MRAVHVCLETGSNHARGLVPQSGAPGVSVSAASAGKMRSGKSGGSPYLGGLALAALLGCQATIPAGSPPPVPRGGPVVADAWQALVALEGRDLYLAASPPSAAAAWCIPIADTPHYVCRLELGPLLQWRGRIVRYAQEIDCLRGDCP